MRARSHSSGAYPGTSTIKNEAVVPGVKLSCATHSFISSTCLHIHTSKHVHMIPLDIILTSLLRETNGMPPDDQSLHNHPIPYTLCFFLSSGFEMGILGVELINVYLVGKTVMPSVLLLLSQKVTDAHDLGPVVARLEHPSTIQRKLGSDDVPMLAQVELCQDRLCLGCAHKPVAAITFRTRAAQQTMKDLQVTETLLAAPKASVDM
jgi:hypothetical protein